MPREIALVGRIQRILQKNGGWVIKTHGSSLRLGLPDLLGVLPFASFPTTSHISAPVGLMVAVEVKVPGEEPTKIQYLNLKLINRAGGIAIWCDDPDTVMEQLDAEVRKRWPLNSQS